MTDHEAQLIEYYTHDVARRSASPLPVERADRLEAFVRHCTTAQLTRVVEVGAGVGRDGQVLAEQLEYRGVDLTPAFVRHCRDLGLDVVVGRAEQLPFPDASADAAWSMSTLMHLQDAEFTQALQELRRVVRPRGTVEVGMWGAKADGERVDEVGRYFRQRTDEAVRRALGAVGEVEDFATWAHQPGGGHYQWARIQRT